MRRLLLVLIAGLCACVGLSHAHAESPSRGVIASDPPEVAQAIRLGYVPWRVAGGNPTGPGNEAEILRHSGWPTDVQQEFLWKIFHEVPATFQLRTGQLLDFNSQGGRAGKPLIVEPTVVAFQAGSVQSADWWQVSRPPAVYNLARARLCKNLDGWRGVVSPPPGPPIGHVPEAICLTCCPPP